MICLKNRTFAVSQTSSNSATSARRELWFAWKIVLLQYHKHLRSNWKHSYYGCDLLEKSYFCSITNIKNKELIALFNVVICLKNRTFAVSQTSKIRNLLRYLTLWFAWKIVLLQYHKHLTNSRSCTIPGCDLLEKSYFCSITNIEFIVEQRSIFVVICLKNRTFAVSQTSSVKGYGGKARCDLLEKSYFCSITNICSIFRLILLKVVICLKNRTFAVSQTSWPSNLEETRELWFAWKIVLLQYHKHQFFQYKTRGWRCDLLEKSYFCSITNIRAKFMSA